MKQQTTFRRLLALILAMAMSLSLLSANVWAAELEAQADEPAAVEAEETPAEEEVPEEEATPDEEVPEEEVPDEEQPDLSAQDGDEEVVLGEGEGGVGEGEGEGDGVGVEETKYQCGDNLTWAIDDNGVLTISGEGRMWDFDGSDGAPWGWGINKVIISDGVTSVGKEAFQYCSLSEAVIGKDVAAIGDSAFEDCNNLATVTIEGSNVSIGDHAFRDCENLTTVTINGNDVSIGKSAFRSCDNLTTVTIKGNDVSIGDYAFAYCDHLTTVTGVPENLENLDKAFEGTPWLKQKKMEGATELKAGQAVNVTLEPGADAWYWVTVPATDLYEPSTTFSASRRLYDADGNGVDTPYVLEEGEKVYVQVTCYEEKKVSGTVSLKAVEYATSGKLGETVSWSLDAKTETLTVSGTGRMPDNESPWDGVSPLIRKVVVEQGVTSVGAKAFYGCINLESVSLADSVTSVGENAFSDCYHLATVTASAGTELPANAFRNTLWAMKQTKNEIVCREEWVACTSTDGENQHFRFTATKDGDYRFQVENSGDTYVESSVYDSQGDRCENPFQARKGDTFYVVVYPDNGDEWKQRITEYKAAAPARSGTFDNGENSFTWSLSDEGELTVNGSGELQGEYDEMPWRDFENEICTITIGEGVTSISNEVFSWLPVTSVNLPTTLTSIEFYAFYYCYNLTSVGIPDSVTAEGMGRGAFQYCTALATVNWKWAETYDGSAFYNTPWQFRRDAGNPTAIPTDGYSFACNGERSRTVWFTFTPEQTRLYSFNVSDSNNNNNYSWSTKIFHQDGTGIGSELLMQDKTYYVKTTVNRTVGVLQGNFTVSAEAEEITPLELGTPQEFTYGKDTGNTHNYRFQASEEGLYQFTCANAPGSAGYAIAKLMLSDDDVARADGENKDAAVIARKLKAGQTVFLNAHTSNGAYGTYKVSVTRFTSGKCGKNLTWSVSGGVLTISGKGRMEDYDSYDESNNIPPWIELADQITSIQVGEGVTYIGEDAFGALNKVTRVELPDGLVAIGYRSINITSMKGITIPGSVKQIDDAFTWYNVIDDFTITGTLGSAAHLCARRYGYNFVEAVAQSAHVHSYGAPTWTWSGTSATATFQCKDGDDTQNVKATVTSATTPATTAAAGKKVYTAKVTFQGKGYTDTRTETIPKLPLKKNTIKVNNSFTKTASAKKKQDFKLNASANGAALSYSSSNNKKVTVDKSGKVTIAKGFVGKVTITIKSAANASYMAAQSKVTISVIPTVTRFKSVKADKKGKVTMTWAKNATAKKYQIEYSNKTSFANAKKLNSAKTKATIKKLGKGTWYFRIKAVNGSMSSKWSTTKKLTVK